MELEEKMNSAEQRKPKVQIGLSHRCKKLDVISP